MIYIFIFGLRFDWFVSDRNNVNADDIEAILPIIFWLKHTKSGDLSECNGFSNSRKKWITSTNQKVQKCTSILLQH